MPTHVDGVHPLYAKETLRPGQLPGFTLRAVPIRRAVRNQGQSQGRTHGAPRGGGPKHRKQV